VVRLRKALVTRKARIQSYEDTILDDASADYEIQIAEVELAKARAQVKICRDTLRLKEQALGVSERQVLLKLNRSEYIQHRMSAWALKMRIRHKLQARKFELDRVERGFHRKKTTGEKADFYTVRFADAGSSSRGEAQDPDSVRSETARPWDTGTRTTLQRPPHKDGDAHQERQGA
jgi:hypothetical protein